MEERAEMESLATGKLEQNPAMRYTKASLQWFPLCWRIVQ
jgi:hypothetical protein